MRMLAMGFEKRDSAKKYTSKDGDSLRSLAEQETAAGNEMTWQDLAKFNWGTDDQREINAFMRDELGCHKRDADNNFVFAGDDEPLGVPLLVPKAFKRPGLPIDKTHVLRVKKKVAPIQFLECACIPGVTFEFDKSFIRPSVVDHLKKLEEALAAHPDGKLMIFGHTDKVGSEQYNKKLSERRAKSVFAFITNDADVWESLYNEENWGTRVIQEMLVDFGFDPGPVDGINGPKTQAAVKEYQGARGLAVDGVAEPATRKVMFTEYMSSKHDIQVTDGQFMDPKHMGCSEFNPVEETEAANEPNRRVTIFLFNPARLPKLPCKFVDIAPCKKQMTPPSPRFNATFKCSFFDSIARDCKCEGGDTPPPPVKETVKPLIQPATQTVVVKKSHTNPVRKTITLKTDAAFDGSGTFTVSGAAVQFFTAVAGGTQITFDGTDNVFTGAQLTAGVQLFAEGASASAALDDVQLTLTLSGGSKTNGPPATATMTSVEVTLDICMSRTAAGVAPAALSATNKISTGRIVHAQDSGNHHGRAMLIIRQARPASFTGTLSLTPLDGRVQVFDSLSEVPAASQTALSNPHEVANAAVAGTGLKLWAEGVSVSGALRDTGFRLGIKGEEPDGDRVAMTVVQFSHLKADIPSTSANTPRLGNSPVPRHDFERGTLVGTTPPSPGGSLVLTEPDPFDEDYTENTPLVFVEGSVLATDPINLSVQIVPAGVPVSWSAQRDTRPAPNGDHPNIRTISPNPVPNLTQNGGNQLQATLLTDAVGSFRIRPFVDCNGNNTFEGDNSATGSRIDREPFILMNLVLIRVQGFANNSTTNPGVVTNPSPPTAAGFTVATGIGGFPANFANAAVAAVHNDATVTVIGGGGNGQRGLDRLFAGWVNNERPVSSSITSPPGEDAVSEYLDSTNPAAPAIHRRVSIWTTGPRNTVFLPGGPPRPALVPGPLLDTARSRATAGTEGTGGNTCVGTERPFGPHPPAGSVPPATPFASRVTQTNQPIGQTWQIHMWDSPGDFCPAAHGDLNNGTVSPLGLPGTLSAYRFNLDFQTDLVFWTNDRLTLDPTDDPACRLYSTVQTNNWTIRFSVTFNPTTGAGTITVGRVRIATDPRPTRLAAPVQGSGIEVRGPTTLSLLCTDAQNFN